MLYRLGIGLALGVVLVAGQPTLPVTHQAWVLALGPAGGLVGDLKPDEFQVKVDGKTCPVIQVKTPAETANASQSWVLVFEPIRDTAHRAVAFAAAADFLTKVPQGDRVLIVARGKDSLESLMPGLSTRRSLWAETLTRVPGMLPEALTGSPKETLQGEGFHVSYTDTPDDAQGQDALLLLLSRFTAGEPGWAKGTKEQRGISVLGRLNFNDPMFIRQQIATIKRESNAMGSLFGLLAAIPGQKHVIVFSRCESDDMSHPGVKRAMFQNFKREKGDAGGPAESATYATGEMSLLQSELKAQAVSAGITLYSVAGTGQNVVGSLGIIAPATGGFAFPLRTGLENTFGAAIQAFGSRYLVGWTRENPSAAPTPLDISTSRKGVKILAQTLQ